MDFVFLIKKLVIGLISPLSISLFFGLIALYAMVSSRKTLAIFSLTLSLLVTWAASFNPVGNALMWDHEARYPAFQYNDDIEVDAVHVLGGGHMESKRFAGGAQLSSSSLARVVEGIRIAQMYPDARLVFSGYAGYTGVNKTPNAEVAKAVAVSLGIDEERIDLLTEAKDTREEAIDVEDFIHDGRLILVTSASHMPRAVTIFKQEGLKPIPAPTYFLGAENLSPSFPSAGNLQKTERYLYEKVGLAWVAFKGWLDKD